MYLSEAQRQMATVQMNHAVLNEAQLQYAHLRGAQLQCAHFNRTQLQYTDLRLATFADPQGTGPQLIDVRWDGANLAVVNWFQVNGRHYCPAGWGESAVRL
jgi:uncharacterized protein YjbI with pentapeptide repeats